MDWSFFTNIFSPITQWLKNRGEISRAKHRREIAIIKNQGRLAQSKTDYNHEWEMASLRDKSHFLQYFSYFQFNILIWLSIIDPERGQQIFGSLSDVPEWIIGSWMLINGSIWGISEFKHELPKLLTSWRNKPPKLKIERGGYGN